MYYMIIEIYPWNRTETWFLNLLKSVLSEKLWNSFAGIAEGEENKNYSQKAHEQMIGNKDRKGQVNIIIFFIHRKTFAFQKLYFESPLRNEQVDIWISYSWPDVQLSLQITAMEEVTRGKLDEKNFSWDDL